MPKNKIFHSPRQHFLFHSTIPLFPSSFTPSSHRCSIFLVPRSYVSYNQVSKMEDVRVRRVVQTEDLSNVEFETSEDVEVLPTFDSMGLREELLRGIYAYGK